VHGGRGRHPADSHYTLTTDRLRTLNPHGFINTHGGSIMKTCPKCQTKHEKPGVHCSRTCANSRPFSYDANEKRRIGTKAWWKGMQPEQRELISSRLRLSPNHDTTSIVRSLMELDWTALNHEQLRQRLVLEQDGKCSACSVGEWNGMPLSLQIHHINGDNTDNNKENLTMLCPNCHTQTDTWCGAKSSVGRKRQKRIDRYLLAYRSLQSTTNTK
jgi:hypothetical protein